MNHVSINRTFWNKWSSEGGPWSRRSPKELIEKAKNGNVQIFVTTKKSVPQSWLPSIWDGLDVLGLAAGGGQQMPLIAATGAKVTTFDLSIEQLRRDEEVCKEEGFKIDTIEGDMQDLSVFSSDSFDLIINPVSNCYVENIERVWKEAFRVLRPGGVLISGFNNPVAYALDQQKISSGELSLSHPIPYSDLKSLSEEELQGKIEKKEPIEFGHSLTSLIGGQTSAGFHITGLYEDVWGEEFKEPLDSILPQFIATRAVKPKMD